MHQTRLKKAIWLGLLILSSAKASAEPATEESAWPAERNGDMMQVGIPLVAFGLTFVLGGDDESQQTATPFTKAGLSLDTSWLRMNGSPRHDLLLALGRTEMATYALKYSINAERPNGGGQSFPSGHTSVAFAGAEFVRKEYGWGLGIPFYLAATYVGWSRLEAGAHWERDVIAGAAIGVLSNHDGLSLNIPFGQLQVAPTLMSSQGAAGLHRDGFTSRQFQAEPKIGLAPGLRLEFRF